MFNVNNSSAIESISDVQDGQVQITWKGSNNSYTYGVSDVELFTSALSKVISQGDSVGSYINRAIREENLLTLLPTA